MRSWWMPCAARYSPSTLRRRSARERTRDVKLRLVLGEADETPEAWPQRAFEGRRSFLDERRRVIWRARSGEVHEHHGTSPSRMRTGAPPGGTIVVAATNSSLSSRAYASSRPSLALLAVYAGLALGNEVVGGLDARPAVVAVHGVVAAT